MSFSFVAAARIAYELSPTTWSEVDDALIRRAASLLSAQEVDKAEMATRILLLIGVLTHIVSEPRGGGDMRLLRGLARDLGCVAELVALDEEIAQKIATGISLEDQVRFALTEEGFSHAN